MTRSTATRHRTLRFEGGTSNTDILDATDGDSRVRTDIGGAASRVTDDAVVVTRATFADRVLRPPPRRRIWLPVGGLWSIEVDGPAGRLTIDLGRSAVRELDIRGSASRLDLRLPAPRGRVVVGIAGSVSALSLERPASTPVSVEVRGNVRDLQMERHTVRAAAGPVAFGEPSDTPAPGYHLRLAGSVAGVRIGATTTS